MKNKKTLVGIVLLIVVLALGIGYAAITSSLTISGTATATANENNFKVVFTGETTPATTTDGVTATATPDAVEAELSVTGLTTKGNTKTATYTIQNKSQELKAEVKVNTATIDNAEFFKVTSEVDKTTALAPNETATVTVTVELIKTPIEEVSGDITVTLGATAVLGN